MNNPEELDIKPVVKPFPKKTQRHVSFDELSMLECFRSVEFCLDQEVSPHERSKFNDQLSVRKDS